VISKNAIVAWVFSATVGVGMLVMPAKAMAHDWDHVGDVTRHEHHDHDWHNDFFHHRAEEQSESRGYYRQPPRYTYDNPRYGYGYQPRRYGYRDRWPRYENYAIPANGQGMVDPRRPSLVWACDPQGHHCHWARRFGSNGYSTGLNPGAFGGNGNGYGNNYANGYYANDGYNSPMDGLGSLIEPMFGGQHQ
jgi:hypothetical protein